jgi:hypothetical protein
MMDADTHLITFTGSEKDTVQFDLTSTAPPLEPKPEKEEPDGPGLD